MKAVVVNPEALVLLLRKKYSVHLKLEKHFVEIEYCGVCHTDLHVAHGDFGQVPGRVLGSRRSLVSLKRLLQDVKKP